MLELPTTVAYCLNCHYDWLEDAPEQCPICKSIRVEEWKNGKLVKEAKN